MLIDFKIDKIDQAKQKVDNNPPPPPKKKEQKTNKKQTNKQTSCHMVYL